MNLDIFFSNSMRYFSSAFMHPKVSRKTLKKLNFVMSAVSIVTETRQILRPNELRIDFFNKTFCPELYSRINVCSITCVCMLF